MKRLVRIFITLVLISLSIPCFAKPVKEISVLSGFGFGSKKAAYETALRKVYADICRRMGIDSFFRDQSKPPEGVTLQVESAQYSYDEFRNIYTCKLTVQWSIGLPRQETEDVPPQIPAASTPSETPRTGSTVAPTPSQSSTSSSSRSVPPQPRQFTDPFLKFISEAQKMTPAEREAEAQKLDDQIAELESARQLASIPPPPPTFDMVATVASMGSTGIKDCTIYMNTALLKAGIDTNARLPGTDFTIRDAIYMTEEYLDIAHLPKSEKPSAKGELALDGDERTKGVVNALVKAGLGREIQKSELRPGDLVMYWRQHDDGSITGHTAIVIPAKDGSGQTWLQGPLTKKGDKEVTADFQWKTGFTATLDRRDGKKAAYFVRPLKAK